MVSTARATVTAKPIAVDAGCAGQCFAAHSVRQAVKPDSHAKILTFTLSPPSVSLVVSGLS